MVLNYIWVGFFVVAFLVGIVRLILFYTGSSYGSTTLFAEMMTAAFESASGAVIKIGLPLAGGIIFFMGIMNIGEKAGVIKAFARLIDPFFRRIFPEIPKDHPAQGSIIMNYAANMLGLDSAATPMGLKAMQELQDLNPNKETASNAQIMFLILNTAGHTIIPVNIIIQRTSLGAKDPTDVFIPLLIATFFSTLAGLIYGGIRQKINFFEPIFLAYLLGISAIISGIIYYFTNLPTWKIGPVSGLASNFFLLGLIVAFILMGVYRRLNIFDTFIEGAKGGFDVVLKLFPFLVALLVGIALFRTCGALDFLNDGVKWVAVHVADFFGYTIDTRYIDAFPTAYLKPLSGGGARAMMLDIYKAHGVDSLQAKLASIFQGAADTTFYIIAVYFGSVGIKNTRYAVTGGLVADIAGMIAAVIVAIIFFG